MPAYVALLRGINLGSRNKVAMPALRAVLEDSLGYEDVVTYIQSGNVVFATGDKVAGLPGQISGAIKKEFGLDIAVFVRTKQQLKKVVDGNPFVKAGKDAGALHVVFLDAKPKADRVKALTDGEWGADEIAVQGREAYLHCPNGYGRTKLGNAFVEKQLGVAGTTRNWRTTLKLLNLACGG
jgi:uncharacterized protein (DUF1697 family)